MTGSGIISQQVSLFYLSYQTVYFKWNIIVVNMLILNAISTCLHAWIRTINLENLRHDTVFKWPWLAQFLHLLLRATLPGYKDKLINSLWISHHLPLNNYQTPFFVAWPLSGTGQHCAAEVTSVLLWAASISGRRDSGRRHSHDPRGCELSTTPQWNALICF